MDPAPGANTHQYMVSLTSPDRFTSVQEGDIVRWHRAHSEKCMLVREYHDNGKPHYHSTLFSTAKRTQLVTRQLERLYTSMEIEFVPRVSIHVNKVTDAVGVLHYLSKDIPVGQTPLLTWGWSYSWIKEQCVNGMKKIPLCMLRKDEYMVQNSSSVQLVVQYARAAGYPLTGKESFITVCTEMMSHGYHFEKIKPKWLYCQVMAVMGYTTLGRGVWRDSLFALD